MPTVTDKGLGVFLNLKFEEFFKLSDDLLSKIATRVSKQDIIDTYPKVFIPLKDWILKVKKYFSLNQVKNIFEMLAFFENKQIDYNRRSFIEFKNRTDLDEHGNTINHDDFEAIRIMSMVTILKAHKYKIDKDTGIEKRVLSLRPVISDKSFLSIVSSMIAAMLRKIFIAYYFAENKKVTTMFDVWDLEDQISEIRSNHQKYGKKYHIITADIESYYTNVPDSLVKRSLGWFITYFKKFLKIAEEQNNLKLINKWKNIIMMISDSIYAISIINKFRFFAWRNEYFKQSTGIVMGKSHAVDLAMLILIPIEVRIKKMFPKTIFRRYIDDIIIIHEKSHDFESFDFKTFENELKARTNLSLEVTGDNHVNPTVSMLDIEITYNYHTRSYRKPTDPYEIQECSSNIAPMYIKGLIYTELFRVICKTSDENELKMAYRSTIWQYLKYGYTPYFLRNCKLPDLKKRSIFLSNIKNKRLSNYQKNFNARY